MVATVEDNRLLAIGPDKDNEIYGGYTCVKGRQMLEQIYHPGRLRQSQKRTADGRFEAMFAVYRRRVLPVLEAALAAGERRIIDVYDQLVLAEIPLSARALPNLNTAADVERWLRERTLD